MIAYRHFKDREAWLKGREKYNGIGASEAAAIVGATSWMTATELWQIKNLLQKLLNCMTELWLTKSNIGFNRIEHK